MKITLKAWVVLLVVAVALWLAGNYASHRYLACSEAVAMSMWSKSAFYFRPKPVADFPKDVVTAALEYCDAPWPLPLIGRQKNAFDPNHPAMQDAATLMGLAMRGPEFNDNIVQRGWFQCNEDRRHYWRWFAEVSHLALANADANQRPLFERLILLGQYLSLREDKFDTTSWPELATGFRSQPTTAASQPSKTQIEQCIRRRAGQIDPNNAVYSIDGALAELRAAIEEIPEDVMMTATCPSQSSSQLYGSKGATILLEAAHRADDLLTASHATCNRNLYRTECVELFKKAWRFRNPQAIHWKIAIRTEGMPTYEIGRQTRELVQLLCFAGDDMAKAGRDELALRLYGHAYKLGEQLWTVQGEGATLIDLLEGIACMKSASEHLLEYWAGHGSITNVLAVRRFERAVEGQFREISQKIYQTQDPVGYSEEQYRGYVRACGLTWWLAGAGIMAGVLSLICMAVFVWPTRRASPLRVSRTALAAMIVAPIVAVMLIVMLLPIDMIDLDIVGAMVVWGYVLAVVWLIAIGLLSRHVARLSPEARPTPTGWVWPVMGLVFLATAVSGVIHNCPSQEMAVLAGLYIVVTLLVWLIVVFVSLCVRRTAADRAYRGRVAKTFAVCSMFAAGAMLLAALVSIPLTRHAQDAYFAAASQRQWHEVAFFMGEDWPNSFQPLPAGVFRR
ncbi:MAG: hypothetical protein WC869_08815 [Phycisphaerae bacterium]|jgi:hypothetical protein